ncbi:ATP-binding protein [uncultured Draconibacterium sp.]|uniref:ATP-binding protein n=1 Tax=uncultured Draconibacterium sp. TaxID=1573823 RepID=UPI0032609988
MLVNLINNSLKFTEQGAISFGYKIINEQIEFFVSDQRIGIPEDKLNDIFTRFEQVNYGDANYGGTGLGLAISKGIVELLGGEIAVKSKLNKGTTFTFTIPLKEVQAEKTREDHKPPKDGFEVMKNSTILIAEDEEVIQLFYRELLRGCKCKLLFANNGEEAVDIYKSNKKISLVLMDLKIPKMNGFSASEEILRIHPEAKIIIQSAFSNSNEKEKSLALGCKDYLTKPIRKELLISTIKKHI